MTSETRSMAKSLPLAIVAVILFGAPAARAADFEEAHSVPYTFPLSPGGAVIAVPQFDDQGGTRELEEVTITFDGEIGAHVTVENDSVLPAPDLSLSLSGLLTLNASTLNVMLGLSGSFFTDGSVTATDGVPGSGPDFWDFGQVTVSDSGDDSTLTNLAPFVGAGFIDVDLSGSGGFAVAGSTDTTITVTDFRSQGTVTIVYGYSLVPTGACCFPDGACLELTDANCAGAGGSFTGEGTSCLPNPCIEPDRGSVSEKGSLVVFHKVEVKWDLATGELIQDTFLSLTNDNNLPVRVLMYFINGDAPVYDHHGMLVEPGWNWVDNEIDLTANQPTYWSAATGLPATGAVSPWSVLDPDGPGRPGADGATLCLRGYIVGWAVNADGAEIRFNHLKGEGTIVNYRDGYAWEYGTMNYAVASGVPEGAESDGVPGVLQMNGIEYEFSFDQLVLDFQAAESMAWGDPDLTGAPYPVRSDTDVTLHPLSVDLRQETEGPVTTKASFTVWNENETKFSGAHRCITCWDQALLSVYELPDGGPNHFIRSTLQTDHGKARIDGLASQLCDVDYDPGDGLPLGGDPRDVVSRNAALLGVSARMLFLDPGVQDLRAAAASSLVGSGMESATIRFDVTGSAPEARVGSAAKHRGLRPARREGERGGRRGVLRR